MSENAIKIFVARPLDTQLTFSGAGVFFNKVRLPHCKAWLDTREVVHFLFTAENCGSLWWLPHTEP